ncbi:MAG: RluA family pseudouridine synthase [Candidatus Peribacteraceae bacterium]|nr:RluA family pseudouridine synthase [Candidatus Peribacteraceae bacterium]
MPISKNRILYEDEHLLMVNKLSGELSVKGAGKMQKLPLYDLLKKDYAGLKPLNRLDFETSGIIIFAKTKEAYEAARESMNSWEKTYKTLVKGIIKYPNGNISKPLPARSSNEKVDAKTQYRVLGSAHGISYVEATIKTGRHHQIRRHFAGIHHPLVLDSVYGDKKLNSAFKQELKYRKFFLHAFSVSLMHPITKERVVVKAELPDSFISVLRELEIIK